MTTCIFHKADFDGLFCRAIAQRFLPPDTTFIGWDHGDALVPFPETGEVYVLDLPPSCLNMIESSASEVKRRLCWIDHHKTSIEKFDETLRGYRLDGVAACRLAWHYFFRERMKKQIYGVFPDKDKFVRRLVSEPLAVTLAGEYDVFDHHDPRAETFQHGLRSRDIDDVTWKYLLGDDAVAAQHCVEDLLATGSILEHARKNWYAEIIKLQGFDLQWEGLTFLACNSHELDIRSQLFEAAVKPHHDALLGFTYNGKSGTWRISMYHATGHEQHDLSAIAAKYGGGGHKGACGLRVKVLPFKLA